MENSCRKNLKQSSKKWVIASVYPKFRRNLCLRSTNADLYHYAGNNPVRYIDPLGFSLDDWQDNGDGTWTVKSAGATLWDIYGADWKNKSGYEGDPTSLHIGDTVGIKNIPKMVNQNSFSSNNNTTSKKRISEPGEYYPIDFKVLENCLYLKVGLDIRPNQGQANFNTQTGIARLEGKKTLFSWFDGKFKIGVTGYSAGCTANAWIGVKEHSCGFGVDASMLNYTGSFDITILGITGSVGGGIFIGGAAKGWSFGSNNTFKWGSGIGGECFLKFRKEE